MNIYLLYFLIYNNLQGSYKVYSISLVYTLHPLIPTEHVLLTFSGDHRDANPIKIFISRLTNLEKL